MTSKKIFAALLLSLGLTYSVSSHQLFAQSSGLLNGETGATNPKDRPVNMSLTIEDDTPPSTPILISPSNGAALVTSTPSFVWEESTDNFEMSHYNLTVDGSTLFSNIPLSNTVNANYTLTKVGNQYTLTPTAGLADGAHTWKITAVDIHSNSADSTTWSFTISATTPTPTLPPGVTATPTETPTVTATTAPEPTSPVATNTPTPSGLPLSGNPITIEQITEALSKIPEAVITAAEEVAESTGPVATAIISGAVPVAATALVATQFGWGLSLQILLRILQAIGILPPPTPQGLVFNSETEEPVPFAILNISKNGDLSSSETVVTNTEGVYGGVQLPPGSYQIEVRHQDFAFPTGKPRPNYLTIFEFYKNELFQVANEKTKQLFLIPVDPLKQATTARKGMPVNLVTQRLLRLSQYLLIPLFILSLIITFLYPTPVNFAVCGIYVIIIALRLLKWLKIPLIVGKVVDDEGNPLANVFVRIFLQESNQLMSVLVTNEKGQFKAFLPKNEYQVSLSKQQHVWVENGEVQNFYVADARKSKVAILAVMQDSQKLYKDLFN